MKWLKGKNLAGFWVIFLHGLGMHGLETLTTVPLKRNIALIRDSLLEHLIIEGVKYEKKSCEKSLLGSLNSGASWFSSDS